MVTIDIGLRYYSALPDRFSRQWKDAEGRRYRLTEETMGFTADQSVVNTTLDAIVYVS